MIDFEEKFNSFYSVYSIIKRKIASGYAEPLDIEYFIKSLAMLERLVRTGNLHENVNNFLVELDDILFFISNNKFLIKYCEFWGLDIVDIKKFIKIIAENHCKKFIEEAQWEEKGFTFISL